MHEIKVESEPPLELRPSELTDLQRFQVFAKESKSQYKDAFSLHRALKSGALFTHKETLTMVRQFVKG